MYLWTLRLTFSVVVCFTICNCEIRDDADTCTGLTIVSCNSSTKQLWNRLSQLDGFFIASTLCPVEEEDCRTSRGRCQVSVINHETGLAVEPTDERPTRTLVRVPLNYVFHRTATEASVCLEALQVTKSYPHSDVVSGWAVATSGCTNAQQSHSHSSRC